MGSSRGVTGGREAWPQAGGQGWTGWTTTLVVLAGTLLIGGGLALWGSLWATFPAARPLPDPIPTPEGGPTRPDPLEVRLSLLEELASAEVEVPALDEGYVEARGYGRGVPLLLPGVRDQLRKIAVAMPLGLEPGSAEEIEHDLRHALYLPSPAELSWQLRLPPRARLSMDVACLPVPADGPAAVVEVTVRARDGHTLRQAVTAAPATGSKESRWTPHDVDLRALAGREVTLRISTRAHGDGKGPAQALVGDPVVLGSPPPTRPRRPNLLWINIDTVQSAVTGIGGDPHHPTPHLDRLAAEGVWFDRAYAVSNWTRPSNLAFLTGRYPSELGMKVEMIPTLAEERRAYYLSGFVALPLQLARHGYRTTAIVQNNLLEDVWGTGVDIGFREYRYVPELLTHSENITRQAIEYMNQRREESWFLYLGYNAPHWPYRPHRRALRASGMADDPPWEWLTSLYRGEVNLSDEFIAPLIQSLKALGLEQDTLVVVNSDHGEQLSAEHAQEIVRASLWQAGESTRFVTRPGHETLYDETARVPLVLWWPGRLPEGRRIDLPTALYDMPPTLLHLMGVPQIPGVRGRSLVPAIFGEPQAPVPLLLEGKSIRAVIDWPFKYIRRAEEYDWVRSLDRGGPLRRVPEELYDLTTDPGELHDIAEERPRVIQRMRKQLMRLEPPQRYLYFLEARAPEGAAREEGPLQLRVRVQPGDGLAALHLLEEEPEDWVNPGREEMEIWLTLPPGDFDRVALRLASEDTQARLRIERCRRVLVEAIAPTVELDAVELDPSETDGVTAAAGAERPDQDGGPAAAASGEPDAGVEAEAEPLGEDGASDPAVVEDAGEDDGPPPMREQIYCEPYEGAGLTLRVGRWGLLAEGGPVALSDADTRVHLDSDRDPERKAPGLYLWRMPVVGGIAGRGGELDEALQETFRGWGYVQ